MTVYIDEGRVPLHQEVEEFKDDVTSLKDIYSDAKKSQSKIVKKIWLIDCLKNLNVCINGNHLKKMGFPIRALGYAVKDLSDGIKERDVHKVYQARDTINELVTPYLIKAKADSQIFIAS
jgi:hypothetical protein